MKHLAIGIVALSALLALTIAGCGGHENTGVAPMQRFTLDHDGLEREYFVFLPSSYGETELPVAVFMHGYGGSATGTEAEVTNGLNRYAEAYGYVMVYPQSTWFMADGAPEERWEVSSWNHISDGFDKGPAGPICTPDAVSYPCPPECGSCGECGWASCHDDVGFLKKLLERIVADLQVDEKRVYVSGFSNGAMMANRIACEASELIAAVALVSGRVEPGFECTPTDALPLLQINGGKDEVVPADGRVSHEGYLYASTAAIAELWNDGAACAAKKTAWTSAALGECPGAMHRCLRGYRPRIDRLPLARRWSPLARHGGVSRQQRLLRDGAAGGKHAGTGAVHCARSGPGRLGISTPVRIL